MHVALVGPCSPVDVADLLDPGDSIEASRLPGYRGIPVSELARGLVSLGHRVTVATTDSSISAAAVEFSGPRFSIVVQKSRLRPRDYLRDMYSRERQGLAGILRDADPDIVHAHWTYEFELAAQDSGLPHVTTAHDAPVTILRQMRDPYRAARLAVALRARPGIQHLSAVAPYLANRWAREMRYTRPIRVIPNSIPQDALPVLREPTAHPTILEVADSGNRKNIKGLLRSFAEVRKAIADAELRLVGPGLGPGEALASWAHSERLSDSVAFLGRLGRQALATEYGHAWLFVHASFEEACPMVLLEAYGAGIPIVGGEASGGVPYVLGEGRAGWLTDVTDVGTLASAIVDRLRDGPIEPKEGTAAFIHDIFAPSAVAGRYADWYSQVPGTG